MQASELPLLPDGTLYHIGMRPGQASHRCMLVGDPGRVALVEPLLETVEHRGGHREFTWITGTYHGKSITILGTGIGADNTEIAILELDALHNLDLSRGQPFPTQKKLYFLRIGTSGLLQPETALGSVVFSVYGVGLDPLPLFYQAPLESELAKALQSHWHSRSGQNWPWYGVAATGFFRDLAEKRGASLSCTPGITYSAAGFYGPQGRAVRSVVRFAQIPEWLSEFSYAGHRVQNIEMEVAPLYLLARALGHEAGALCLGVAHRRRGELMYRNGGGSPEERMRRLLQLGLEWLAEAP